MPNLNEDDPAAREDGIFMVLCTILVAVVIIFAAGYGYAKQEMNASNYATSCEVKK